MTATIILCTVPDKKTGAAIAAKLITSQIAACANMGGPVSSYYLWDGKMQEDEEYQLIIKTTAQRVDDAYACVCELHPYDVPEWLVINEVNGSQEYLTWINQTVTPTQ
ncbi:divalent-cation tolerance protein CutA [Alteromonas sp. ASW11-19]|uniref:Divalent-cation tolerance protein CutA n=1 Tax=Alteromonas salexigens TaxID=2982530 RepID=A0ABT2VM03_9ALTE|nr:divalent-cation tolerance protein CutA [Alteromonas salexigens]MCU7553468.1 divalent-cation tolerance protein CutA [Alteromonas salexigens]